MADVNVAETLVVDKDRLYSEQERDCATAIQGAIRGLQQRRTFTKLQNADNPKQAVTFSNAVRESSRIAMNVTGAHPEVESATQAPVGALLAMYTFHKAYRGRSWSHLWALWKCFWAQSLFDLPLGVLAHVTLLWFAGIAFYAPMWASLTVRFIFYDGEGQVEIEKYFKWLFIVIACATAIWTVAATCFTLLQERFGNRMKWRITIVAAEYGKLVSKEEVDLMRTEYLSSMKRIFFHLLPEGMACLLILLASLNFLFIRSHLLGGLSVVVLLFSGVFLAVYDSFVSNCSKAFEESVVTESEFWAHLASSHKDVALGEIVALSKATALYSFKSSFFHIAMGGAYRLVLIFAPVFLVYLGSLQLVSQDLKQFELLFCFFYFLTVMACMLWLNKATVELLKHLGGAFRLAHFIHGTVECIPRRRIRHSTHTIKYGVVRIRESLNNTPWGVILMTVMLIGCAIGSFVYVNNTSEASLACRPAEVHCKLMDGSMHRMHVEQEFDMDAGCVFEKNNGDIAEDCVRTAPVEVRLNQQHYCLMNTIHSELTFTYKTGQNRTNGITMKGTCDRLDLCEDVRCAPLDDCHLVGECVNGMCSHPVAADGIACSTMGERGTCLHGVCSVPHDTGRRLDALKQGTMARIDKVLDARKGRMLAHRRQLTRSIADATSDSTSTSPPPPPPVAGVKTKCVGGCTTLGCTDQAAFNYHPLATVDDGSCCVDSGNGEVSLSFPAGSMVTAGEGWSLSSSSACATGYPHTSCIVVSTPPVQTDDESHGIVKFTDGTWVWEADAAGKLRFGDCEGESDVTVGFGEVDADGWCDGSHLSLFFMSFGEATLKSPTGVVTLVPPQGRICLEVDASFCLGDWSFKKNTDATLKVAVEGGEVTGSSLYRSLAGPCADTTCGRVLTKSAFTTIPIFWYEQSATIPNNEFSCDYDFATIAVAVGDGAACTTASFVDVDVGFTQVQVPECGALGAAAWVSDMGEDGDSFPFMFGSLPLDWSMEPWQGMNWFGSFAPFGSFPFGDDDDDDDPMTLTMSDKILDFGALTTVEAALSVMSASPMDRDIYDPVAARRLVEDAAMDDKQFVWKVPYGAESAAEGHMEYGLYGQAAPNAFGVEHVKVAADETSFDHPQDGAFVPGLERYDNTIMQAFHDMPSIAYCSSESIAQWSCPLCQSLAGISDVHLVNDDDSDAKAFIAAATHAGQPIVQLVFYGSMQPNLLQWADEAELVPFEGCEKCAVHKGFLDDYQDLAANVRSTLSTVLSKHPGSTVQILGQGFGAALVPFAAVDLIHDFPVTAVLTLGKPRVGNLHFSDFYQASAAGPVSFRLVHWRDPLPHVPPMEMGFIHEAQEVWYDESSTHYRICTGVEHPDCSNAVYVFNVTDHLSFFGGNLMHTTMECAGNENIMVKGMSSVTNVQKLMAAATSPIHSANTEAAVGALPDFMQDLFQSAGFTGDAQANANTTSKLHTLVFDSPADVGFDQRVALQLAAVAEAQMCHGDSLTEYLADKMQMGNVHVVHSGDKEATAVLAFRDNRIIVVFLGGVLTHLSEEQEVMFCADCKVSAALLRKFNSLRAGVTDKLTSMRVEHSQATVTITGMGEGGGLATLFALESAQDATVVTFGAPQVGNADFAKYYKATPLASHTFRVVHWRDPVPHMPGGINFTHVGAEIFYNQDSSSFRVGGTDAVSVYNFLDHFNYMGKDVSKCMLVDNLNQQGQLTLANAVLMTVRDQGSALLTAPGTPIPAGLKDLFNVPKYFDTAPDMDTAMRRPGFDLPKEAGFPMEQAIPAPVGTIHNFYPNNFDHTLVAELAHLPFIAFCDKDKVEAWSCGQLCSRMNSTSHITYIADEDPQKAAAIVAVNHDAQILVIFKAGMPTNGLSDFEFMNQPGYCDDCKVHRGMYAQYIGVRRRVIQAVRALHEDHAAADVTLMGWSFGGVLATYGALDLAANGLSVNMVVTMGMPRAGNDAFVNHYHSTDLRHITWRITHWEDPITHMPPSAAGWHHVGTEVWYNSDFSRYRICDGSGEDGYCSASKPGFKLNGDHFTYFEVDYALSASSCGGLSKFGHNLKHKLPALGEMLGWIMPLATELS